MKNFYRVLVVVSLCLCGSIVYAEDVLVELERAIVGKDIEKGVSILRQNPNIMVNGIPDHMDDEMLGWLLQDERFLSLIRDKIAASKSPAAN